MFYIPFTGENVKEVLAEFNYEYKGLSLAIAQPGGSESWHGSATYSIYNIDEFLNSNFEDALAANRAGFLKDKAGRVVTEGAVERYIMDKQAKREQAEKEFKEFKERQRSTRTKARRK